MIFGEDYFIKVMEDLKSRLEKALPGTVTYEKYAGTKPNDQTYDRFIVTWTGTIFPKGTSNLSAFGPVVVEGKKYYIKKIIPLRELEAMRYVADLIDLAVWDFKKMYDYFQESLTS